jgi:phosphoribosyl 1,2-cyclic phosphodiesterase
VKVTFWGVRGSIACPGAKYASFGGNTSCIEVSIDGQTVIFDSGTGIRPLGKHLLKQQVAHATVLFSHTHSDHIAGFPFFTPAYDPSFSARILAGHLNGKGGIRSALSGQMNDPIFPVPLETMRGALTFEDFHAGDTFQLFPGVKVRTARLNHPNGATGYRLEHDGVSLCYVTDTEHIPGKPDENILSLIEDADLVIYDSTYTDDEFPSKVGWGHSTWQEGVRLAKAASVKQLAVFHHDPDHDDAFMNKLAAEVTKSTKNAFVAREGQTMDLERVRPSRRGVSKPPKATKPPRSRKSAKKSRR